MLYLKNTSAVENKLIRLPMFAQLQITQTTKIVKKIKKILMSQNK